MVDGGASEEKKGSWEEPSAAPTNYFADTALRNQDAPHHPPLTMPEPSDTGDGARFDCWATDGGAGSKAE